MATGAVGDKIKIVVSFRVQRGLNRGTSGNVSARFGDGLLVTPSGVVPDELTADSIVFVDATGESPPDAARTWSNPRRVKSKL